MGMLHSLGHVGLLCSYLETITESVVLLRLALQLMLKDPGQASLHPGKAALTPSYLSY